MKSFAKKSLSVLLAVILASTMFVSVFAQAENSEEIVWFNLEVDYKTNQVYTVSFDVEGYSVLNVEDFACSIFDSLGNEVFDETMCDVEDYTPEDLGFDPGFETVWLNLFVNEEFVVTPDEIYTLVVAAGSYSNAAQELSPELTLEFLPSDFIYVPTIWDNILEFLYSHPVLEFVFAPLVRLIEMFRYDPLSPWTPYPFFG